MSKSGATFFVRRQVLVDGALLGLSGDGEIMRKLALVALRTLACFKERAHHRLGIDACATSSTRES